MKTTLDGDVRTVWYPYYTPTNASTVTPRVWKDAGRAWGVFAYPKLSDWAVSCYFNQNCNAQLKSHNPNVVQRTNSNPNTER